MNLKQVLSHGRAEDIAALDRGEIEMKGEETKLQLAYDSPLRFANPVDSDPGVRVNDHEDLIADKLLDFYGRVEPRDAVDLFSSWKARTYGNCRAPR